MDGSFDLVTGGAGFIGSHLCEALLKRGEAVKVIDNLSSGKMENLEGLGEKHSGRFEFNQVDIRRADELKEVFRGVRRVFHLAALTSVEESVRDPIKVNSVNVDGTLTVLEAARQAGAKKLIFASSTAVYGDSPELRKNEDGPLEPLSPYAVGKLAGENYCRVFSGLYGLPTLSLRFFNVYGPRQDPGSPYAAVVPRFACRIASGLPPVIFGDGQQTRDFVYIEDVVLACRLAAESTAAGLVLNVASGRSVNLKELAAELNRVAGTDLKPVHEAPRLGEVRRSAASIDLARSEIGYEPQFSLNEGLRRTFAWFQQRTSY